ncbi:MAG: hypothetical protein HY749_21285 [Gammaproteobacteria bacterium]|nr:hypothetical protein [Gammaproteobacteria bacterium]MBI5618824.1 hypothetical protein [Gammaproteobacteria bacterium]
MTTFPAPIVMTGYVEGAGNFDDVVFPGTASAQASRARVDRNAPGAR